MVESRQSSRFEKMVKKRPLMAIIMLLPFLNPYDLSRFCQLNKASLHIMQSIVNFQVLFKALSIKLAPPDILET